MIAAVVGPFAEALRATFQPCTFLLIVPILTAVVAARASWQALTATTGAAVVGGWILVDNRWVLAGWQLRVSASVVVGLLVALVVVAIRSGRDTGVTPTSIESYGAPTAVGVISLIATMWWRPCVGTQLGAILNGAQDDVGGQLLPMAAYMLGAMMPVALVVAVRYAVEPSDRLTTVTAVVVATAGVALAIALVAGQHDDVVVTLTRWTSE